MSFNTRVVLGIIVFGVRVLVVDVWVYLCVQEDVGGGDVLWRPQANIRHHQISFLCALVHFFLVPFTSYNKHGTLCQAF